MINFTRNKERGELIITADNESRAELAQSYRCSFHHAQDYIAEALHECFELTDAADCPEAWCTDAPFLIDSDGVCFADNGQKPVWESAQIYTYPDYVFSDPWQKLKNCGRVAWEAVEMARAPAPSIETLKSYLPGGEREGQTVWFGETTFPDTSAYDESILKAWPELARNDYEPDRWDCGLYFWRDGKRFGPFANSPQGYCDAESAGAPPLEFGDDYTPVNKQGELFLAA